MNFVPSTIGTEIKIWECDLQKPQPRACSCEIRKWRSSARVSCSLFQVILLDSTFCTFFLKFLVCNEVPEEPVLSPVSNNVFERRLIVKYIHENGTDPINGEPLTEDQLLEIKGRCKSEGDTRQEVKHSN